MVRKNRDCRSSSVLLSLVTPRRRARFASQSDDDISGSSSALRVGTFHPADQRQHGQDPGEAERNIEGGLSQFRSLLDASLHERHGDKRVAAYENDQHDGPDELAPAARHLRLPLQRPAERAAAMSALLLRGPPTMCRAESLPRNCPAGPMTTAALDAAAARPKLALRPVRMWLYMVASLIVAMVVVGGLTRLTGSGLSITEWAPVTGAAPPLSEGAWESEFEKYRATPQYALVNKGMTLGDFKSIYLWEWGHRFLGRLIGVVFLVP